jgi:hypothetical protein
MNQKATHPKTGTRLPTPPVSGTTFPYYFRHWLLIPNEALAGSACFGIHKESKQGGKLKEANGRGQFAHNRSNYLIIFNSIGLTSKRGNAVAEKMRNAQCAALPYKRSRRQNAQRRTQQTDVPAMPSSAQRPLGKRLPPLPASKESFFKTGLMQGPPRAHRAHFRKKITFPPDEI